MVIPQSKKLQMEEASKEKSVVARQTESVATGPVQIRKVEVTNDFVAILQFQVETGTVELPESVDKYKNEGLVIGVGPSVRTGVNANLIDIGDVVMFGPRNKVAEINSDSPPYKGNKVIIVSERNVICRLPTKYDWVEYKADA